MTRAIDAGNVLFSHRFSAGNNNVVVLFFIEEGLYSFIQSVDYW
ncbi:hypothetical protein FM107_02225 [Sphingobacterium sp. JB170]|nr:hypothetical protein FM107_02225 [Sphingobacterium sp. JB170]